MRSLIILFTGIAISIPSLPATARPISYPDGWSAMTMNDGDSNSINLQYSPTATYSVGYTGEYLRNDNAKLHVAQINLLLKRWNNPDSQGNFYMESGVGIMDSKKHITPAAFTGITTDWEDRRFLVSYRNRIMAGQDVTEDFTQWGRVGIAPYIGDYGDLHTWMMVELRHSPENKDPVTATPLIRLFKDTNMIEMGVSNQGKITFNFMKQF
jgi:hypothetical protein